MLQRFTASALILLSLTGCIPNSPALDEKISSFEDCVAAGYPVMESYPEQCRTPDGRTFVRQISSSSSSATNVSDLIVVEVPTAGNVLSRSVTVLGEARGQWYFEATFPIELLDAEGNTIVETYAEAQDDWMTTEFVPFMADVTIPTVNSDTGTLVLHKSNASGLPEHDASLRIPVRFR